MLRVEYETAKRIAWEICEEVADKRLPDLDEIFEQKWQKKCREDEGAFHHV